MFPEADRLHRGEPLAPVPKAHLGHGSSDSEIPPFDLGGDKKPLTSQELTFSYLCDNPHGVLQTGAADTEEHLPSARNILDALGTSSRVAKGKEVASGEPLHGDRQCIEKDFLQLGGGGPPSKREAPGEDNEGADDRGKRAKLCLPLVLPNLQLSLFSSIPTAVVTQATTIGTGIAQLVAPTATTESPSVAPAKRTQSANTYTTRTSSDDFTASRTYSYYSNPFSHNPSCSLTHNSTDNYAFGRDNDQIWCAGEGTNGSVHSRFKPIGDTIGNKDSVSHHHGYARQSYNVRGTNHSPYIANSSDNCSFFPSDVPANQRENAVAVSEGHKHEGLSRPDGVLRAIVSESVSIGAQMLQDASSNSVEGIKDYLRNLITAPDKIEFSSLQRRLERRSDLTHDMLLRAHRAQLDILVSIKTGLANFLSRKNHLPTAELVEIFLLSRCKNVKCRSLLPVDDCDCKICSTKMGFCSACMCPICLSFDCASNTCSWVGCDVCSHWCHAACGIQQNLIRSGRHLGGDMGTTETQFYCLGCGHASEMFGFVKEVFLCCARDWGIETLIKELDCVKKIFHVSEDTRGKELHDKAEEMLSMLDKKLISPIDACNNMVQFLKWRCWHPIFRAKIQS